MPKNRPILCIIIMQIALLINCNQLLYHVTNVIEPTLQNTWILTVFWKNNCLESPHSHKKNVNIVDNKTPRRADTALHGGRWEISTHSPHNLGNFHFLQNYNSQPGRGWRVYGATVVRSERTQTQSEYFYIVYISEAHNFGSFHVDETIWKEKHVVVKRTTSVSQRQLDLI